MEFEAKTKQELMDEIKLTITILEKEFSKVNITLNNYKEWKETFHNIISHQIFQSIASDHMKTFLDLAEKCNTEQMSSLTKKESYLKQFISFFSEHLDKILKMDTEEVEDLSNNIISNYEAILAVAFNTLEVKID